MPCILFVGAIINRPPSKQRATASRPYTISINLANNHTNYNLSFITVDTIEHMFYNCYGDIMDNYIMHLDVNNAFLSWTAVEMLKNGFDIDIRTIPAIIGGDEKQRHGIVLAKSNIAKQFGIKTAETIYQAKKKCPQVRIFPSKHAMYQQYSDNLYQYLLNYTDKIERFSIDECFIDFTDSIKDRNSFLKLAKQMSREIKAKFGYTVNIGLSNKKVLAKMASDFEKPDKIHTLYTNEVKEKMWPLPIGELFMVGRKSVPKLHLLGINYIGDLAQYDKRNIVKKFGKFGETIWNYANGIDNDTVHSETELPKGIGNSVTLPKDCSDIRELEKILLALTEKVTYRLRKYNLKAFVVNVQIKTSEFITYSHQTKLSIPTDSTKEIYSLAKKLLQQLYKGQSIRLIGFRIDNLKNNNAEQINLFEKNNIKNEKLDKTIDRIKDKYGYNSITLAGKLDITNIKTE